MRRVQGHQEISPNAKTIRELRKRMKPETEFVHSVFKNVALVGGGILRLCGPLLEFLPKIPSSKYVLCLIVFENNSYGFNSKCVNNFHNRVFPLPFNTLKRRGSSRQCLSASNEAVNRLSFLI